MIEPLSEEEVQKLIGSQTLLIHQLDKALKVAEAKISRLEKEADGVKDTGD